MKKIPYRSQASLSYLNKSDQPAANATSDAPVCSCEHGHGTRDSVGLARVSLHADPACVSDAQEVVDNLETLFSLRIVGTTDVHDLFELALRMVAEESEDGHDARRRDVQRQLVLDHGELLDELGKTLDEVGAVVVQLLGRRCILGDGWVGRGGLGERRSGCWVSVRWEGTDTRDETYLGPTPTNAEDELRGRRRALYVASGQV